MLSEHTLQGFLQGYTLTGNRVTVSYEITLILSLIGRTGLFPSYEAFLGIVTTMVGA